MYLEVIVRFQIYLSSFILVRKINPELIGEVNRRYLFVHDLLGCVPSSITTAPPSQLHSDRTYVHYLDFYCMLFSFDDFRHVGVGYHHHRRCRCSRHQIRRRQELLAMDPLLSTVVLQVAALAA